MKGLQVLNNFLILTKVFGSYITSFEEKMAETSSDNPPGEDVGCPKFGFDQLPVGYGMVNTHTIPVLFVYDFCTILILCYIL